jgi:hypothetical protein
MSLVLSTSRQQWHRIGIAILIGRKGPVEVTGHQILAGILTLGNVLSAWKSVRMVQRGEIILDGWKSRARKQMALEGCLVAVTYNSRAERFTQNMSLKILAAAAGMASVIVPSHSQSLCCVSLVLTVFAHWQYVFMLPFLAAAVPVLIVSGIGWLARRLRSH